MIDISVNNRQRSTADAQIGAIVCHTPKTIVYSYKDENNNDVLVDHRRELVTSVNELIEYFGDPFICPSDYPDLVLVYDLVRRGNLVYISSVRDMKEFDDEDNEDFNIKYNGYTEFTFLDNNNISLVGYKLKSDIKFCQPFIRSSFNSNILTLYVDLYRIDRSLISDATQLAKLDKNNLYITYYYVFEDLDKLNDELIISALQNDGLELKVVESNNYHYSLTEVLLSYPEVNVHYDSFNNVTATLPESQETVEYYSQTEHYRYTANGKNYYYDFDDINVINNNYVEAIDLLLDLEIEPHLLHVTKLNKSTNILDSDSRVVRSVLSDLDYDSAMAIYSIALDRFNEDSNTYLYINMPSVTYSTAKTLLSSTQYFQLPERYNCDLYFGCATDYIYSTLQNNYLSKVTYTSALLSFYNLLGNNSVYMNNSVVNLNVSNNSVKSIINERSAVSLANLRCNSIVLFDTGSPSIYGDRSLSLLPNLRYSHISRNLVRLRRLVREYLETKKFTLNTMFTVDGYINYIRSNILDTFKSSGVLKDYSVSYSMKDKAIYINVILLFLPIASSINLTFTI